MCDRWVIYLLHCDHDEAIINRRYVPSKRDVLNWIRGYEIGTAIIEKLKKAKVYSDYVELKIFIVKQETLGIHFILQHDESTKCFRIVVVTELMRRCHALRASGVMVPINASYFRMHLIYLIRCSLIRAQTLLRMKQCSSEL